MIVSIKDAAKLFCISIVACCAVFVCTLFLSFNMDIAALESQITSEAGLAMYDAVVNTGIVVSLVSGLCLALTSAVMLLFYVKNYLDDHGKELGVLKALGHSRFSVAKHFWVFGLCVLIGCAIGYAAAMCYLPSFYKTQNADGLLPEMTVGFHASLMLLLVFLPALIYTALAVLYAMHKMRMPALDLMREKRDHKVKLKKGKPVKERAFLTDLVLSTLKSRKTLVFFVAFAAFCFSAMVQMSMSVYEFSSASMSVMMLLIGLVLAFVMMILSLSSVVKGNSKTIAMLRVTGYSERTCSLVILGAYRPIAYAGFAVGTLYQFGLMRLITDLVFANLEGMPEYNFSWVAFAVTLAAFIAAYELIMFYYSSRIKKVSLKAVMQA